MERSGIDTYILARQHFETQFARLNKQILVDPNMQATMDPNQNIKVFIYDSIEFLTNLYLPGTGVRVLELILSNVRKKLEAVAGSDPLAQL